MNNPSLALLPLFLAATLAPSIAQAQIPEVAALPERISFTMTVIRPPEPARPESKPSTPESEPPFGWQEPMEPEVIEVTRLGDNRHTRIIDRKKNIHLYWIRGNSAIVPAPDGTFVVFTASVSTPPHPFYSPGFFGSEIARPEHYIGLIDGARGGKAHYFRAEPTVSRRELPPGAPASSTTVPSPPTELWLDPTTLRPIAWQQGPLRVEFSYRPSTASIPSLPAAAEDAWKEHAREAALLEKMRMN